MIPDVKKEKLIITQANVLALSAQKMTLQEKRLLLLLVSQVRMSDTEFHIYHIPINTISEYLDLNGTSLYSRIREISKKLLSRVVDINEPYEGDDDGYKQFQWVSRSRYLPKSKSPINTACLEMRLHEDLYPFLLNIKKHFGSVPLLQIATMPSFISIRVVEILYFTSQKLTKNKIYFNLEDFKSRLHLTGKYNNFKDFRKDVLERAQKDCQNKSPLNFSWEETKKGRKIIGLSFLLEENKKQIKFDSLVKQKQNQQIQDQPIEANLQISQDQSYTQAQQEADQALKRNGVDQKGRESLIKSYEPEQIIENSKITLGRFQEEKLKNLAGSTVIAVKTDWRVKKSPYEKEKEEKKQIAIKIKEEQENKKNRLEILGNDFEIQKRKKTKKAYDAINADRKKEFILEFEKTLNRIVLELYKKGGLESPGVKVLFNGFVAKKLLKPEEYDFIKWAKSEKGCSIEKDRYDTYQLV